MIDDRPPILIVDDHDANLVAVEAVLEGLDVEVIRAASGEDALRHLLARDVALILLDVQMPTLDGFETARLVKSRPRTANVPIIFLTALDRDIQHELAGYDAGAVDYLRKPLEPAVLRSKVAGFAALYRQAKTIEAQRQTLAERVAERDRAQAALHRQAIELERSNSELERIALVASQELLEPLQVITGLVELAAEGGKAADTTDELLRRAATGLVGLGARVATLLEYARASSDASTMDVVDLDEVLADVQAGLGPEIATADAEVTADPLPTIHGDRWQLSRVFAHLLLHALSRPPASGELTVHVGLTRQHDTWTISVRDNGRALEPDQLGSLFSLVAGGDPGLALVRRVVQRHGGEVSATSAAEAGTSVSFSLPAGTES